MKEDTSATLARIFVEDDHYKVLKRLEPLRSGAELTGDASRKQLALLDVETIGFDPKHDVIIELALMCVELDEKKSSRDLRCSAKLASGSGTGTARADLMTHWSRQCQPSQPTDRRRWRHRGSLDVCALPTMHASTWGQRQACLTGCYEPANGRAIVLRP